MQKFTSSSRSRVGLAAVLVIVLSGAFYAQQNAQAINEIISFSASVSSCNAPCSPQLDWNTNSENIVNIYRGENGSTPDFQSNQNPSGNMTDWNLSAGSYTYVLHVINSNWQDVAQSSPVTVTVSAAPTPITCGTLAANPTSVSPGGSINWAFSWSPAASGLTAYWVGTKNGQPDTGSGVIAGTVSPVSYAASYACSDIGLYTRKVEVRDAAGAIKCSTNTVNVTVNYAFACCGNGNPESPEQCDAGSANNGVCPKTCGSNCFTNTCSTAVTCSLAVNPASVNVNSMATWTGVTNTAGLKAYWSGTNVINGATTNIGEVPITDASGIQLSGNFTLPMTYACAQKGTYTRRMVLKDSAGTVKQTCPATTQAALSFNVTDTANICGGSSTSPTPTPSGSTSPAPPPPPGFGGNCTNPSPALPGYALPCPVLNVTPLTVGLSQPFSVQVTKGTTSYIYRNIFISVNGAWRAFPTALQSASIYDATWATGDATFTRTPLTAGLTAGDAFVATWDWTHDAARSTASSQCWLGPGATTCNSGGKWRVQKFTVQ